MLPERTRTPPAAYFIADHLDAVLAASEDLRKLKVEIPPARTGLSAEMANKLRAFVEQIQRHELTIVMRTLEARKRIAELQNPGKMLRLILGLFTGGTAALADAAEDYCDTATVEFATAGDTLDFLRARNLLPEASGSLIGCLNIEATEEMLIAERVPLGDIMDHAAAVMDALELYFDLYSTGEDTGTLGEVRPAETLLTPPLP